jgi:DHA2 family lincomycin resistance protein-like MFS transporter
VLSTAQATSAGNAAFLTAFAIGLVVLVGTFFIGRTPGPAHDGTAAERPAVAGTLVDSAVRETVAR